MVVAEEDATLLTVCENGYGKRTPFGTVEADEISSAPVDADAEPVEASEPELPEDESDDPNSSSNMRYRRQRRGGKGLRDIKTTDRNGKVMGILAVHDGDDVLMVSQSGTEGTGGIDAGEALALALALALVPADLHGVCLYLTAREVCVLARCHRECRRLAASVWRLDLGDAPQTIAAGQVLRVVQTVLPRAAWLRARGCRTLAMDVQGLAALADACAGGRGFTMVTFTDSALECGGLRSLAFHSPRLALLDLAGQCMLSDRCMHVVARLSRLRFLRIAGCLRVTDRGLSAVAQGVAGASLRHLDVSSVVFLGDAALHAIQGGCPRLLSLHLQGLPDVTIHAVSELLTHCQCLRELHCQDTGCRTPELLAAVSAEARRRNVRLQW